MHGSVQAIYAHEHVTTQIARSSLPVAVEQYTPFWTPSKLQNNEAVTGELETAAVWAGEQSGGNEYATLV